MKITKRVFRCLLLLYACCAILIIPGLRECMAWQDNSLIFNKQISQGRVKVDVSLVPFRVKFAHEIVMKLRVIAPSEVEIKMPVLRECVEGFTIAGMIQEGSRSVDGIAVTGIVARLIPYLSSEYWVGPIVVEYFDRSSNPPAHEWITIRPLRLEHEQPGELQKYPELSGELEVFTPGEKTQRYFLYFISVVVGLAVFIAVFIFLRRTQEKSRKEKFTPYQGALYELDRIQQSLGHGVDNVKLLYTELTEIIRRYIDTTCLVKARNLTTMELIPSLARKLNTDSLGKLHSFLELADAVKFAEYTPDREIIMAGPAIVRECLVLLETIRKYQTDDKSIRGNYRLEENKNVQIC